MCVFTGCASAQKVNIVDGEWCALVGKYGATCNYTFSDKPREIAKESVDTEMFGWLATRAENFASWKLALEQICLLSGMCSGPVKKQIANVVSHLSKVLEAKDKICAAKRDCPQLKFHPKPIITIDVE